MDVHFTKADVVSVGAVVAESQQTAALGFCHRGDAERFLPGLSGVENFVELATALLATVTFTFLMSANDLFPAVVLTVKLTA